MEHHVANRKTIVKRKLQTDCTIQKPASDMRKLTPEAWHLFSINLI
jgi:hypothetical protein